MFVADGLKPDPLNKGWVKGWGVMRGSPGQLIAVYASKDMAETKIMQLGHEYRAVYGSHRLGTDDFIGSEEENK